MAKGSVMSKQIRIIFFMRSVLFEYYNIYLEYLLKITRILQALGLNTKERAGILVLVSRLINLEDMELRKQYIEELKGENEMAELNWLEEYFRKEAATIAEKRGRNEWR